MYRVMVVDDEPQALKSVCRLVERRKDEFVVAATAEDGQEALQKARENVIDLIICDIKMPILSGVELAEIIQRELPEISFIIISGYQDFEYARTAMRVGVIDYLLKPIVPSEFLCALEHAAERICGIQYVQRSRLLHSLVSGTEKILDEKQIKRCMPDSPYYAAVLRANGLPKRFGMEKIQEKDADIQECFVVLGRDEMESLHLIPAEYFQKTGFEDYLEKLRKQQKEQNYYTLVYDSRPFGTEKLQEIVKKLYQTLDCCSSVGVIQCLDLEHPEQFPKFDRLKARKKKEEALLRLEVAARTGDREAVKQEISREYEELSRMRPPQLWMESFTRKVLELMQQYRLCRLTPSECEYFLGEVFYNAVSMKSLSEGVMDLLIGDGKEDRGAGKADSREYFEKICQYLETNMGKALTLPDLCCRFGISQTYMSRLFRKYSGNSFNQFLTELRMERARALFAEHPDLLIKDAAMLVGYEDPFYFSRLFRSYTGRSPSEYQRELSR